MSLKLFFAPGACSFVPHTLLELIGAPFEPCMVKLHKGEQYEDPYKALNPRSQVPVLVDGDQVITQILAIITHLDLKFPQARLLPVEPLARVRAIEMLAWMNNTVHPTFTHIFMPYKFTDKPELHEDIKRFAVQSYRALLGELQSMVLRAQAAGQEWLAGDRFGPQDAYALTLTRWGTMAGIDPQSLPSLWAHVEKLAAQPAVARVIERERLQLNVYKG